MLGSSRAAHTCVFAGPTGSATFGLEPVARYYRMARRPVAVRGGAKAAAAAGASHVWAFDDPAVLEHTASVCEANGWADRITLVPWPTGAALPRKLAGTTTVDVIIAFWAGPALVYAGECPAAAALEARDRWLAADGLMFPSRATLTVALADCSRLHASKLGWWRDVYGFDMERCAVSSFQCLLPRHPCSLCVLRRACNPALLLLELCAGI